VSKGNEMIVPGDQLALVVQAAFQKMETAGTVLVVLQIVFTAPG